MVPLRRDAGGPSDDEIVVEWDEPSGVRDLFDEITPTKPVAPELLAELSARDGSATSAESGIIEVAEPFDDGGDRPTFPVLDPAQFAMALDGGAHGAFDVSPSAVEASVTYRVESSRAGAAELLDQLGGPRAIVHQALLPDELAKLALDPRAAFVVSLADGATTIDDLLDLCGMSRDEALGILADLAVLRILHFEDP